MIDLQQALAQTGSARFQPAQRLYIEALLRRAEQHPQAAVREQLEERAEQALQRYDAAFERARDEAQAELDAARGDSSNAGFPLEDLLSLFREGDFRRLRLELDRLRGSAAAAALASLTEHLNRAPGDFEEEGESPLAVQLKQQEAAALGERGGGDALPGEELRAGRRFRNALQHHSAQRLVTRSIDLSHPESGPLNPERLVVDSLKIMRQVSPHYLSRFVAYVDTLFWLEQAAGED